MTNREKLEKKYNSLVYNHIWLRYLIDYGIAFIFSVLSAAIFSFGLNCFLDPNSLQNGIVSYSMVSGGSSGLAQTTQFIFNNFFNIAVGTQTIYSICYLLINIPIVILAFKGIGKRFGFFTLVNVAFVSLFSNIFRGEFFIEVAKFVDENAGLLGRALFAGLCTGLSSAIAFKIESSAGGFDVVSYYFSLKKGDNTGHYTAIINAGIIGTYAILHATNDGNWAQAFGGIFFSAVYLFTVMLLIDLINIRNKKAQIEIVTDKENLPDQLIAYVPHGATLLKGKGVYTGKERIVVHMVVSINEVKKVVKIVNELDKDSFVNVTQLQQVYGRFHMKPIK